MSGSALIVRVADTERDERHEYVFAHSPIRVGRSQLNELPLEHAFVSHCHALLLFDCERVTFVDIGSTNGSFLHGRRLDKNQRVTLSDSSVIGIGTLRLDARLERRDTGDTRASYAFRSLASEHAAPDLARAPVHARSAPEDPGQSSSLAPADAQQRSALLNLRFAQAFVELRRGQQQLLRELGLPTASADRPHTLHTLHSIDSAQELLVYLLDPHASDDRVDELSRAYADLMMHEVALVSAIGAGCRELLDELSPENLAPRGLGGLAGWVARLFGHDARWRLLESKTEELKEQTALSSVVLGRGFARAYLTTLGKSGRGGDGDQGPQPCGATPAAESRRP